VAGGERLVSSCLGFLGQVQPRALPSRFIAGFDSFHGAGDIKNIAAALLRLRNQPKSMAAEWMAREKKIKHRTPRLVQLLSDFVKRNNCLPVI
jgi:hypothetical protein